jgi:hypothetical protein
MVTTLSMQTDGNLVYRCNGHVGWSSGTHVRGSFFLLRTSGDAVIFGPGGYPRWSTHTAGAGSYTYFVMDLVLRKVGDTRNPLWQRVPASPPC